MYFPLGTLVNVAAVLAGGGAGLLLHKSFPERYRRILLTAGGLATLALGAQMAIGTKNPLVLIGSLYLGAVCGEALGIEAWLGRAGERLRGVAQPSAAVQDSASPTGQAGPPVPPNSNFTTGLVTAFLVFCVGPLTLVGALNDGMSGDHSLLLVKSALDLATSFALASSFGAGVMASALPLAVFQLAITGIGMAAGQGFSEPVTRELTAVGGALILGLGLNLLDVAKLRVSNLLPALLFAVLLALLAQRFGG